MEYLKNKFNKDIYNIIYNYIDQSENHLIKSFNKVKYTYEPFISGNILDCISKSIHLGYAGISLLNTTDKNAIDYAVKYIKDNKKDYISITIKDNFTCFYIKGCNNRVINIRYLNIVQYIPTPKTGYLP